MSAAMAKHNPSAGHDPFAVMAEWTEQMYAGLEKLESAKMIDQLMRYHKEASERLGDLESELSRCQGGELLNRQKKAVGALCDGFQRLKSDVDSKYKVYLRGCGKAGKSTLLNALLSLDEELGSQMGRIPITFTIDTYTDELPANEAEIRRLMEDGRSSQERMSREAARQAEEQEDQAFKASKAACEKEIRRQTEHIFLESEKQDITEDIYRRNLLKTTIREIVWGIGENPFFHNCVLIDTPGLSQELRFTNVIEDVKEYEIDGIIWVISSDALAKDETVQAYQQEMETFRRIYSGGNIIAVINMYGSGPDYCKGSRLWNRIQKKASAIYCGKYGFDEVICVNAKLAYDGNLERDAQKLEDSNLAQLRMRINQLFVKRMSQQVHQEKLNKIESFLDNLYRDVEESCAALEHRLQDYDSRAARIEQLGQACQADLRAELNGLLSRHLMEVRNHIEAHAVRLNEMAKNRQEMDSGFLRRDIVAADNLERQAKEILTRCQEDTFQKFRASRSLCIISEYRTEDFALEAFERVSGKFSVKKTVTSINLDIHLQDFTLSGFFQSAVHEITSGFGSLLGRIGSTVKRGLSLLQKPMTQLIYEEIEGQLYTWSRRVSMDEMVEQYVAQYMDILDKSMAIACGRRDDIQSMTEFERDFVENRQRMEWSVVELQDLIG